MFPVFAALLTILGVGVIARPPILTGEDSFDTETLVKIYKKNQQLNEIL